MLDTIQIKMSRHSHHVIRMMKYRYVVVTFGFSLLGVIVGPIMQATGQSVLDSIPKPVTNPTNDGSDVPIAKIAANRPDQLKPSVVVQPTSREALLEARIRELEQTASEDTAREMQLEQRLKSIESSILAKPSSTVSSLGAQLPGTAGAVDPEPGEEALTPPGIDTGIRLPSPYPNMLEADPNAPDDAVPGYDVVEEPEGVPPSSPGGGAPRNMPFTPKVNKGYVGYGPGFVISSDDDEYQFQFHDLTQLDLHQYNFQTMDPTKSGFAFSRERLIMNGRLTKPYEYYVALNFGYSSFKLIDAFLNIHYDDRLQVKIGRFKTPWSYEFYGEPINGLINPERSIFYNNYGPSRDTGVMVWGQLFGKTTDYAVGVFNGVLNGFVDNNNAKSVVAYFNTRPLEKTGTEILKHWNIGGSVLYNTYNSTPRPGIFRTNVSAPGNPVASAQWLILDSSTLEFGSQKKWALHSAWYYDSLSLIAEWFSGYNTYANHKAPMRGQHVVSNGWYVQSGYFLTGEKVTSRGMVSPLHPFNPKVWDGIGAFELAFRWANQSIDKSIFMFSPENRWTNDTNVVDLGVNWYWNDYVKFYVGWERAMYGKPIQAAPGLTASSPPSYWMSSTDMLWVRAQFFF